MIALSILCKAYAATLLEHRFAALALWAAGMACDWVWMRRDAAERGASFSPGAQGLRLLGFQAAAALFALTAAALVSWTELRWKTGIPTLAAAAAAILRAFGVSVSAFRGDLFLNTMAGPLRFHASLDHLGLALPAAFLAAAACLLWWRKPSLGAALRPLVPAAALLLLLAITRYVVSISLFLGTCDFVDYETEELPISPFYRKPAVWLSFLPFLLACLPLWQRLLAGGHTGPTPPRKTSRPLKIRTVSLAGAGLFALCLLALWPPRGELKQGRILINTYHTLWSRTDRPYDRNWYGADSGYNYACLKEWLSRFYEVKEWGRRLTPEALADVDVLIVYLPSRAFTAEEVRAVRAFVRRGGGLLVMGDHTNVFGSNSNLNPLCAGFGFEFRNDVLFDLDEDFFQLWDAPPLRNSVVHGISFFKFRGPASIRPLSWFARPVMTIGHSKSFRATYSVNNFYPPPRDRPAMKTGRFAVSVSARFGRGRVLAFGDTTVFSNFEIFYPGKCEWLLNAADWLNHRDGPWTAFLQRAALLAAAALLAGLLATFRSPRAWLIWVGTGLAAFHLARLAALVAEDRREAFPQPIRPTRLLYFAVDPEDPIYRLRAFTSDTPYDQRYDVFIQWALRTGTFSGFYPIRGEPPELYRALAGAKHVVSALGFIVHNTNEWKRLRPLCTDRSVPRDRMLLMFSRSIGWSWLRRELESAGLVTNAVDWARIRAAWPSGSAMTLSGDKRLLLIFSAERFSDQKMGFTEKVHPTPAQRALYEQEFALINALFGAAPSRISSNLGGRAAATARSPDRAVSARAARPAGPATQKTNTPPARKPSR
ncbi:MAG: Gldg family protein [Verrucomicrobia bacterium]|nr:Gldg family protein [Verrucomicrobiota bacterium]